MVSWTEQMSSVYLKQARIQMFCLANESFYKHGEAFRGSNYREFTLKSSKRAFCGLAGKNNSTAFSFSSSDLRLCME